MDDLLTSALAHPGLALAGRFVFHALWQGSAVALLLTGALRATRGRRAEERYALACLALAATVTLPLLTALVTGAGETVGPAWIGVSGAGGLPLEGWLRAAGAAWLAGVGVLILRWAAGVWTLRRLTRRATSPVPTAWTEAARRLSSRLELRTRFALLQSARVDVPTVIGWLRPVILMPMGAMSGLAPRLVEALLAHELAHLRRHDVLINHLQEGAEALLFFHPAVRWISARIREERELACDDLAAAACGDAVVLARALVALEEGRPGPRAVPTTALSAGGGSLARRIRRLVGSQVRPPTRDHGWLFVGAAPLCLAVSLIVLHACSTGTPQPVGSDSTDPSTTPVAVELAAAAAAVPDPSDPYRYDPFGKRDPYRAYDATVVDPPRRWRGTPAQEWELGQLSMVGILRDDGGTQVMLEDPKGQGHMLEVGDFVGKRHGQITRIQDREMVVTEWIRDADFGRVPIDRTLELPEPG